MLINLADFDIEYDDKNAAEQNRKTIDRILGNIIAHADPIIAQADLRGGDRGAYVNLGGKSIRMGGLRDKLVHAVLWVDLSSGPIEFPTKGNRTLGFVLEGNGGVTLQGTNSPSPTTPVLHIERTAGATAIQMVSNCWIRNDSGSGIYIKHGGDGTVIENVVISVQGDGKMDDDKDTSLSDLSTASYCLKIDDTDGARVNGVIIRDCKNHGVLVGRWHFGVGDIRIHGSEGAGFRGKEINGCHLHIRAESCGRYGTDIHNSYWGTHNVWHEACRRWSPQEPAGPVVLPAPDLINVRLRQTRYRNCESITLDGWRNWWRENLVEVDEGTRNALTIKDMDWHEPSDTPIQTGANLTPVDVDVTDKNRAQHNFDEVWTGENEDFQPQISLINPGSAAHILRIDIPAGCYDKNSGKRAYFQPFWDKVIPTGKAGDAYFYSCRFDVDQSAIDYCKTKEDQRLQPAIGNLQIASSSRGTESQQSFVNFWNTKSRRFGGRIFLTGPSTPQFQFSPFFVATKQPGQPLKRTGMQKLHPTNPDYPTQAFQIRISDIKIWYLPDV